MSYKSAAKDSFYKTLVFFVFFLHQVLFFFYYIIKCISNSMKESVDSWLFKLVGILL